MTDKMFTIDLDELYERLNDGTQTFTEPYDAASQLHTQLGAANTEIDAANVRIAELEAENARLKHENERLCFLDTVNAAAELEARLAEAEQFARDVAYKLDMPYTPPVAKGDCVYLEAIEKLKDGLAEAEAKRLFDAELVRRINADGFAVALRERAEQAEARATAAETELNNWKRDSLRESCNRESEIAARTAAAEARAEAVITELKKRNEYVEALEHDVRVLHERSKQAEARVEALQTHLDDARTALDETNAERERLRAALEKVEYHQAYTFSCPWCFNLQEDGHKPDCARQAALSPEQPAESEEE